MFIESKIWVVFKNRYQILCTLFFLFNFSLFARIDFYNINDLFNISLRETASTIKDDYGFIWVSSKKGILRLTDDEYRIYQLPYNSTDVVFVKVVYKNSNLFAYTNNGQIFKYNILFDRFDFLVHLGKELDMSFLILNNILIDNLNNFWIATNVGLVKYDYKTPVLLTDRREIFFIEWYNESLFFLATKNELLIFDIRDNRVYSKLSNLPGSLFEVSKIYFDSKSNKCWIGSKSDGLYVYDMVAKTISAIKGIPKQPILAMDMVSDISMLVGIDGQGLWEINNISYEIVNIYKENPDKPNSIRGNGVYDVFYDKSNRVWVCTFSGGVSYFNKTPSIVTQLEHITNEPNSLVNNDVNDVLEDCRGFIWFATNNGISRWEVAVNKWETFYHNKEEQAQVFLSLCDDSSGNLWAGTYASGVYLLNGITGRLIKHFPREVYEKSFKNDFVFDIIEDAEKNIWIVGALGDIICFDYKTKQFKNYGTQSVYVIKEYTNKEMLLGCSHGLTRLNKETGNIDLLLGGYLIHDLLVIGSNVWMCTVGEGLVQYDMVTKKVVKYDMESGLPSNFVNSIFNDNGFFWLGTENGLCRFNPNDKTIETFPAIMPLWRLSFNRNAHFKRKNGEIIWGTNGGAIMFNPLKIIQNQPKGAIYFQDITVLGRSLRADIKNELKTPIDSLEKLNLKHNQNTLSVEVISLGMTYGAKFSSFLESVDIEWSKPANINILNYTNLPTGTFKLKIRMYDNSLSYLVDEREIIIIKAPPFWKSWWFLSLVAIILLLSFILSMKYYLGLINQLHSKEKIRFFANTAHDMRTSLTLIRGPLEEISHENHLTDNGKYYLKLAKEQVGRLNKVVNQLMDFEKADVGKEQLSLTNVDLVKLIDEQVKIFQSLASLNNVNIKFSVQVGSFYSLVDKAMIEKVIGNIISNAVKYSKPEGTVDVEFSILNSKWRIEVKDQGIGISKNDQRNLFKEFYRGENAVNSKIVGSGIGLLLAKKYIAMHKGEISFSSKLNNGTTIKIFVPVNNKPDHQDVKNIIEEPIVNNNIDANKDNFTPQKTFFILIADDDENLRDFLEHALSSDYFVATAPNGNDAWELTQKELPDLIVSDIMMPKMDGFELCRLIKTTYETSHIPVILLTSLSEKSDQLHGLGLGGDDYLTKPFDVTLLKQRIKSIIANREVVRNKAMKLIKGPVDGNILLNKLNDQFVKKAIDVVKENISNADFNKDMFSSELNVSGSLLYKKIKSLTDQSPSDFIKSIRLTNSLELLQSRKYTITEVSELCGFTSVSYFSTVFKKHFGKSPSEIIET